MIASGSRRRFPITGAILIFFVVCCALFISQRSSYESRPSHIIAQSLDSAIGSGGPLGSEGKGVHGLEGEPVTVETAPPAAILDRPPIPSQSSLPLPSEYLHLSSSSKWCNDRFEVPYLTSISKTQAEYCDSTSTSSLRCFNSPTGKDGRTDSFCLGGPSLFDAQDGKFKIDCHLREWDADDKKRAPPLSQFPNYWYQTGPRVLMSQYMGMNAAAEQLLELAKYPRKFTILIRREEPITNLWHELMEISSLFYTMDVLRMSRDPATGSPLWSLEDAENTRILVVDDRDEGPYFDLWTLFAKRPITRLSKITEIDLRDPEYIIVPLPGESNPMWQGDWKTHSCGHSALLDVFSQRIMSFLGVDRSIENNDSPLVLTFIDRREKRQLIEKEDYVEEVKRTYPQIKIQMVNFAAIPFTEQLRIIRDTDVLVGAHGAGLTHALFLRPGSAMVEILPADFNHKGFRNLARLMGHRYFSSHALSNGTEGNWQYDDFSFEKPRFMQLINAAITSSSYKGLHDDDVV
ncbi:MAG: hypothetical protein LQ340_006894 [Diploschistes diacapsis]|nr:MAG: hypothetical protein LQ340_006894 [Diploschistes diacapsis]